MNRVKRIFSRELIRKVNQQMIDGFPFDMSLLPANIQYSIKHSKYSKEQIDLAWKKALQSKSLEN